MLPKLSSMDTKAPDEPKLAAGHDGRMYSFRDKRLLSLTRQLRKNLMRELGLTTGRQWNQWRKQNRDAWRNLQSGQV